MTLLTFQFSKRTFQDYFKAKINCRRLPFPTLDVPLLSHLKGNLLEQIECLKITVYQYRV